jgi:hypothetical protein
VFFFKLFFFGFEFFFLSSFFFSVLFFKMFLFFFVGFSNFDNFSDGISSGFTGFFKSFGN